MAGGAGWTARPAGRIATFMCSWAIPGGGEGVRGSVGRIGRRLACGQIIKSCLPVVYPADGNCEIWVVSEFFRHLKQLRLPWKGGNIVGLKKHIHGQIHPSPGMMGT